MRVLRYPAPSLRGIKMVVENQLLGRFSAAQRRTQPRNFDVTVEIL
jgi:hypothetical protein